MQRGVVALIAALGIGLASSAQASDPEVNVQQSGAVRAEVTLPAAEEQIRSILGDPEEAADLSPDVISVVATPSGECFELKTRSRGLFRPLVFESRRCPTSEGWHEVLVSSDDFTAFDGEWTLNSVEGGTQVIYVLSTETNLPVPDAVVRQNVSRSLQKLLDNLAERL